jgi:hypothetical protein
MDKRKDDSVEGRTREMKAALLRTPGPAMCAKYMPEHGATGEAKWSGPSGGRPGPGWRSGMILSQTFFAP